MTGAVWLRSRDGQIIGNVGHGRYAGGGGGAQDVGVKLNDYQRNATVANNRMNGFNKGYEYTGNSGGDYVERSILDIGNRAALCKIAMEISAGETVNDDTGIISRDFQCERITETGILIGGPADGADLEGFVLRGPFTNAAIQVGAGGSNPWIDGRLIGEVINAGSGIPVIKGVDAGGTSSRFTSDIRRRGTNGFNTGITPSLITTIPRRPVSIAVPGTTVVGTSSETDIWPSVYTIPGAVFAEGATLKVTGIITITDSVGNKTLRLRRGGSLLNSVTIPAGVTGTAAFEFLVVGRATNAQTTYARAAISGNNPITSQNSSAIDMTSGGTVSVSVQLQAAGGDATPSRVEVEVAWP